MSKTYEQGVQDGLQLYGSVCSRVGSCEDCQVGRLRGSSLTCPEFMAQFPSKMHSILLEADSEEYTYFNEYMTRFTDCNLTLKDLSDIVCRKAIFEGYMGCEGGDCLACWSEQYIGDISVVPEEPVDETIEETAEEVEDSVEETSPLTD